MATLAPCHRPCRHQHTSKTRPILSASSPTGLRRAAGSISPWPSHTAGARYAAVIAGGNAQPGMRINNLGARAVQSDVRQQCDGEPAPASAALDRGRRRFGAIDNVIDDIAGFLHPPASFPSPCECFDLLMSPPRESVPGRERLPPRVAGSASRLSKYFGISRWISAPSALGARAPAALSCKSHPPDYSARA